MSKTMKFGSRSHSHSASRSRSRSESPSRSRSRSSSRSRSRKHRYGSRSRSRSKSHSPPHNRERKQPREYQNHREFRGYHRGFRRPYYFRGRGRGFFRGRFQRGGGGYNNYRSNNWQNFRQYPQQKQHQHQQHQQHQQYQQHQQQHYALSPKRGRSHSYTPKKRSSSPQSRGHSRRSDRSSSPHSHHSSSSSSSRQRSGSAQHSCKSAPDKTQRSAGDETLSEQGGACPESEGGAQGGRAPDILPLPMNHDSSTRKASPQVCSAVAGGQGDPAASGAHSVSVSSGSTSNGSTCWQTVTTTPSTTSPSKKNPATVFSGFGLFSDIDQQEDKIAMSMAFKKFLEEQKTKKQASANTATNKAADSGNASGEKRSETISDQSSDHSVRRETQKYKLVGRAPLLCEDEEEEEDEVAEQPCLPKQAGENVTSKRKSKLPPLEVFEEQASKLEHIDWDDELKAFLLSQKQERAASFLAALSKREKLPRQLRELSPGNFFREPSPERPSKVKRKEKATLSPSPTYAALPRRSSERPDREMVMIMSDESPPRPSGKRETEFNLRMDSLSDNLARSSVLCNDWRNAMEFVHPDKKEQEFHSVFQHLPCNRLCTSSPELFAQHLVAIVHHIKAQYFPSSGMTLNDRFAMYQRIAAEKEMVKPRKSPEIHRRIDVSPSAFKRHSLMFDELKSSVDSSFKADGKQLKGDTVDLRLDIEHRNKYISRDPNDKQEGEGESGESPGSDKEISTEKSSKHLKKSKKGKKKRGRSHSSSCSSAHSLEEGAESTEEGFSKAQLQLRDCPGPVEKGQFRGWNKVNSFGNNSISNSKAYMSVHPKSEDWDTEHLPKNRKYYLQVGKDGEGERKWVAAGGRGQPVVPRVKGRFILRRPTSACTTNNSNWSHEKFQTSGEDGDQPGNSTEPTHKKQNSA